MRTLWNWHRWLGWVIAVPLLLWTVSGLFMVSFPIEQVRGTDLKAKPAALPTDLVPAPPPWRGGATAAAVKLRGDLPVWVLTGGEGERWTADARTGRPLPSVDAAEAARLGSAAFKAPPPLASVTRYAAPDAPLDLRQERPSWRVEFTDGLRVYLDADTGEVLAVRSRLWRAFDWMWGWHILDPGGREDTHHPLLIALAALSLAGVAIGTALLFRRRVRQ